MAFIFTAHRLQGHPEAGAGACDDQHCCRWVKAEDFQNCALIFQVLSNLNAGAFFELSKRNKALLPRISSSFLTTGTEKGQCSLKENIVPPVASHIYWGLTMSQTQNGALTGTYLV